MDALLVQLVDTILLLDSFHIIDIRDGVILITADDTDDRELLSIVYRQAASCILLSADRGIQRLQLIRFLREVNTKISIQG